MYNDALRRRFLPQLTPGPNGSVTASPGAVARLSRIIVLDHAGDQARAQLYPTTPGGWARILIANGWWPTC